MGSELLKIAEGFSMVAEGLRGLSGMESCNIAKEENESVWLRAT